jgi:hypothetical protein
MLEVGNRVQDPDRRVLAMPGAREKFGHQMGTEGVSEDGGAVVEVV